MPRRRRRTGPRARRAAGGCATPRRRPRSRRGRPSTGRPPLHEKLSARRSDRGEAFSSARRVAVELDLVDPGPSDGRRRCAVLLPRAHRRPSKPPGERRLPVQRQAGDEMLARRRGALGARSPSIRLSASRRVLDARKIDGNALKLRRRSSTAPRPKSFAPSSIVTSDRRLRSGLVDVPPLRIARHHDGRPALFDRPLMNVAERPVGKPVPCRSAGAQGA